MREPCQTAPQSVALPGKSDVEAKFDDVAVAHDVILSLDPQFAGLARLGKRTERDQVVEMDGFGGDETALEIGMDHARGGRRLFAGVGGAGARLLFAIR